MNKVILVGNLGSDPALRYGPSGDAIANFQLATTDKYKDKTSGDWKEVTEWHRCAAFGRQAEVAGEYLRKGSSVYIEGKLRTRKYQAQDGTDRFATEVRIDNFQMLGRSGSAESAPRNDEPATQAQPRENRGARPASNTPTSYDDDDLPF